jgi:hypothetical protein
MIPHTRMTLLDALCMGALDFLPWVLFFFFYCFLSGSLVLVFALVLGVSAAVLTYKYFVYQRQPRLRNWPKTFDVATFVIFVMNIIITIAAGSKPVQRWLNVESFFVVDVACWMTCFQLRRTAGSRAELVPFMAEYAREYSSPKHWNDPAFRKVTFDLSVLWAILMLFMAVSCVFTPFATHDIPPGPALRRELTFDWIIPLGLFTFGLTVQFFMVKYAPPLGHQGKLTPLMDQADGISPGSVSSRHSTPNSVHRIVNTLMDETTPILQKSPSPPGTHSHSH